MRTQDEIVTRYEAVKASDMFGWKLEVLAMALDFEHARPFLKPDATADIWPGDYPLREDQICDEARQYLAFALEKAGGHRGISASRSVEKLGEFLWLLNLGPDRFESAPYENYGVPALFVACQELGVDLPTDEDLVRMSQGLPCDPDGCDDGCGA